MDLITAHGCIASRSDFGRSLLPMPDEFSIEAVPGLEPIAPIVTAAISLSGMLDDAETQEDLDEAAEHFETLLGAGVFTLDDLCSEAHEVISEVLQWGQREGVK